MRPPRSWWKHRAPLVVALVAVVLYLILRLIYRLVFGGIPESPQGWGDAVVSIFRGSALVIALVVLGGLANVVVDVGSLLARFAHRGPARRIRSALVIGLSSFPALLRSAREVRLASRLRGDASVVARLVPVLERSLERGVRLGDTMDSRGFGHRGDPMYGMCDAPVIARDLLIGRGTQRNPRWMLDLGSLRIGHGEFMLVSGPTGCGKSTLLHALSGRLQHSGDGWQAGVLEVGGLDRRAFAPHVTASFVALVDQNPRDSFVSPRVRDELAFTPRALGWSEIDTARELEAVSRRLGIHHLLDSETTALSAGEATLVGLAAALTSRPSLLILDEPIADLDAENTARVVNVLRELVMSTGITIIVAEHRWAALAELADWHLQLEVPGCENDAPAPTASVPTASVPTSRRSRGTEKSISALCAPNGTGKTTWMTAFALANGSNVRLVPEDPALLFSRDCVHDECQHNDRLARLAQGTTQRIVLDIVPTLAPDAHPRDLSTGQRLALACALQAARAPDLLLIDEPTRGLDERARHALEEVLRALAHRGTSVIFATHDREFASRFSPITVPALPSAKVVKT